MNKKINQCVIAFLAVLFLVSCGGASKTEKTTSVVVKPKSKIVKGDLTNYFEVVDKEYSIEVDENSMFPTGMITVEIKRTNNDFDFNTENINPFGTNGSEDFHIGFGIEILSDSGPEIIKSASEGGMSGPYSSEDVTSLMNLKQGETGYIRWSIDGDKLSKLKTFQITSAKEKSDHSSYSDSDNESVSSSNGDDNWDEILISYEKYINQYIVLVKKANKGDASAMAEYPSLMEKASDLAEKIENASNNLSSTQMAKFTKLQVKFANAVAEIQ